MEGSGGAVKHLHSNFLTIGMGVKDPTTTHKTQQKEI